MLDDSGLDVLTPVLDNFVDPIVGTAAEELDKLLIGENGEGGLTTLVVELGQDVAAIGEGTPLDPVTDLVGDLVSDLGGALNTVFNQDLLDSETSSSTANIGGDANDLVDNLTTNADTLLDGLLGTEMMSSNLVDDTSTALMVSTSGEALSGDETGDATLLDGVVTILDQGSNVVDTLATEVGLEGVTEPLTEGVIDATATDLLAAVDDSLIGTSTEPGLLDQMVSAGDDVIEAGTSTPLAPVTDLVGHAVSGLGDTVDVILNQDVANTETGSSTETIAGPLVDTLTNMTTDTDTLLDTLLGTGALVSDLVDDGTTALLEDTVGGSLDNSEGVGEAMPGEGTSTLDPITQPLTDLTQLVSGGLIDPMAGG
ncbi:MAG: hypothetical protein K0M67_22445 [Thiobacillus sp.]|nr:hypothetical protein [Thiobacillus sp.]